MDPSDMAVVSNAFKTLSDFKQRFSTPGYIVTGDDLLDITNAELDIELYQMRKAKEEKEMTKKEQILNALKSATMIITVNSNNEASVFTADDIKAAFTEEKAAPIPATKKSVNPFSKDKTTVKKTVIKDSQKLTPVSEIIKAETPKEEPKQEVTKKPNAFVSAMVANRQRKTPAPAPENATDNEARIKELQSKKILKPNEAKELKKLMGDDAYAAWKKTKESAFLNRINGNRTIKKAS